MVCLYRPIVWLWKSVYIREMVHGESPSAHMPSPMMVSGRTLAWHAENPRFSPQHLQFKGSGWGGWLCLRPWRTAASQMDSWSDQGLRPLHEFTVFQISPPFFPSQFISLKNLQIGSQIPHNYICFGPQFDFPHVLDLSWLICHGGGTNCVRAVLHHSVVRSSHDLRFLHMKTFPVYRKWAYEGQGLYFVLSLAP